MLAVAELTIRKMKEPAFFLMLCLALLLGYCISDLDPISAQLSADSILSQLIKTGDNANYPILTSTCFAFAMSLILASFWGAAEIPRDISSGLIQIVLSKPVRKTQYMLGKYIGVLVMCMTFFVLTEVMIYFGHYFSTNKYYEPLLMFRQFYIALAFIPFVAIIIAFSCFVGDLASIILTVIYILFSVMFNFIPILFAMLPENIAADLETPIFILYYIFPNYIFYFIDFKLFGVIFFALLAYSLSIAAIFLTIAGLRLNSMDFNNINR